MKTYDETDIFRPVVKSDITHNVKIKIFPDGTKDYLFCDRAIFREGGFVERYNERKYKPKKRTRERSDCVSDRSLRRAKAMIREYSLCNDFSHFVTLTVSPEKLDRYSIDDIYKHLRNWLSNAVSRRGLKYVLIPEHHKDGAIHFHGLFTDSLDLVSSGTFIVPGHKKPIRYRSQKQRSEWEQKGFSEVFNIAEWKFGFSTAIRLYGDHSAAVAYVCKYIDKQFTDGKIGGRLYYSGGDLHRARVEFDDMNLDFFMGQFPDAFVFHIPDAGLSFALVEGR